MGKKVKFFNRINVRILLVLVLLFAAAAVAVSFLNAYVLRSIYEQSFTDKVITSNSLMASLIDGDEVKHYVELMEEQDEAFKLRQAEFNADREELLRLQEEGASEEEMQAVVSRMEDFHQEMAAFKDGEYAKTLDEIKRLKEASGATYVYVVADTGVKDSDGEQLYTYIFDAEDDGTYDSPDKDGLGTASYFEEEANKVYESKEPMDKVLYYNDEPYGELYFAYAPILDSNGDVAAVIGTDLDLKDMNQMITRSLWLNDSVFIGFAIVICILIYVFMNRYVARPLGKLTETAQQLAGGDVYASVPPDTLKYDNELGLLAHAIDDTGATYQDMIKGTEKLFEAARVGKLDVRSDPSQFKGDIAKVVEQFNATMDATTMYLNSIPEGLFIMSKAFELYFSNTRYAELFGRMDAKLFVETVLTDGEYAPQDELRRRLEEQLRQGVPVNVQVGDASFSVMFREISLKGFRENSVLGIAVDITDLMNEKMNAQAANTAKSEFLSRVSHELRTPMNVILGMSGMGLKEAQGDQVKERFRKIDDASRNLLAIINDVLDMSRIESGKMELNNEVFDLRALLRETTEMFTNQAEGKGLKLELVLDDTLPPVVEGDQQKLRQVMMNLCSNALKFTEEGGITVQAQPVFEQDANVVVEFSVKDTGIGMNKEFIKKIFTPFEQESVYLQRKYTGTGLGLPICKNLVSLMGGEIRVESEQGVGSAFTFDLPLRLAEAPQEKTAQKTSGATDISGMRVLLVDDLDINRIIFSEMLSDQHLDITEAADGEEALEAFQNSAVGGYDIIFMDIQMPNMDGYEATRRIRALDRADHDIPIIAMTANALKQDVDQAMGSGMDGHIAKPIDYDACIALMRKYFRKKL